MSDQPTHPQSQRVAVACLSGGMDSTSLLCHLLADGYQVFGLSYDYGQKHVLELERLEANLAYLRQNGLAVDHHQVDLAMLGDLFHSALTNTTWDVPEGHYAEETMRETVVPNRNAIFSSIAYGYALSLAGKRNCQVRLSLGVHSGDHAIYPDCRPEFYQQLMAAFAAGNWDADRVELYLPYLHGDKFTILKDAEQSIAKLELDFDRVFANTSTSYAPDAEGRASGTTGSDVERILAFHQLGREDPIPYAKPWPEVLENALKVEREFRED